MKLTLGWLKDHLDTGADLATLAHRLTMIGLEVDGIEDRAADLSAFTVAKVVSAEPHPQADRLRVCIVETAMGRAQVVCGAPNARAGMTGVFAPAGSTIPGTGDVLKATTIRGVESSGMLVSEREMGLSDTHEGIIDLPDDTPLGTPFAEVMGLADPVIEIGLTPNRGDCAAVRGIGRDLAAAGLGRLKPVPHWGEMVPGRYPSPIGVRLDLIDEGACPMYAGRHFRGLRNGPSPDWLQRRLRAVGLRPISTLVDITNFFTLDLGRPLHVFDAAKLAGGITVRAGRDGETMPALDGRTYTLDAEMTAIADDAGPVGLGGIIGGEATGCGPDTTEMFLECALFDPLRTASTGRRLGIHSDARYRFERGVDPSAVLASLEVATRMILDLCGGEASEPVVAGAEPSWRRTLTLRPARVAGLGGVAVPPADCRAILEALEFAVAGPDAALQVEPPPWRPDVHGEADLVEEVVRIHGYDAIPVVSLPRATPMPSPALTPAQTRPVRARRALAARGMVEAVTYSFMPASEAALFGGAPDGLRLANPISADLDVMRPSILPNLVAAARRNRDRGAASVALFEVGPQYETDAPDGQRLVAAGLRAGSTGPRHWSVPPRGPDAFDVKADALAALAACGAPVENLQASADAPAWYHPGRSGSLRLGPTVLARFGELHPAVLDALSLDGPVAAFEAFLDRVPEPKTRAGKARPPLKLAAFQPVERDFAFVVAAEIGAEAVARAARGADRALIADVQVFDVYAGDPLGPDRKSVAIAVTLQPTKATLTEAEIDAVGQKIVAAVGKATGGTLRT